MKKRGLALFLMVVMVVVSLAACGKSKDKASSKDKEEEKAQEEEKEVYHFTIWGSKEDLSDENGSWLKTRCDMFSAKYPDDEVEFEFAAYDAEEMEAKMKEDRENAPDIFIYRSSQIEDLVEGRLLTRFWGDTEEYVESSNATSIANLATYKDKVYGIPVSANPYVLYYDKRVYTEEDVKSLDAVLAKGVVSFPLENETYLEAFYGAKDVIVLPEEKTGEEQKTDNGQDAEAANGQAADASAATDQQTGQETSADQQSVDGTAAADQQTVDEQSGETADAQELTKESVDTWLAAFRENPNVLNDADGTAGVTGLQNGTVQAAVYDANAYQQMKEILGENLGVAALPTFTIDGVQKQMKCVVETKNIGVNPDCENFEMTIALATYLGSADSQQMHYDMSGVLPVNLTAVKTLMNLDLTNVIAQIADKENPGWDIPEEEEED